MRNSVVKLSVLTLILFSVSLGLHFYQNRPPHYSIAGTYFLAGLDVGKVGQIRIEDSKKNSLILERMGERFVLVNHKNYPSNQKKINDFLFELSDVKLKTKMSASDEVISNYHLSEENFDHHVILKSRDLKVLADFYIGKNPKNQEKAVKRVSDNSVYTVDSNASFSAERGTFIEQNIFKVTTPEITSVTLGDTPLEGVDDKKKEKLKELYFADFHRPDELAPKNLSYDKRIAIELKSGLQYIVDLAKDSDKHYARISLDSKSLPEKVAISREDGIEKLKNIDGQIQLTQKIKKFNEFHQRWVYEISDNTYEDFTKL